MGVVNLLAADAPRLAVGNNILAFPKPATMVSA